MVRWREVLQIKIKQRKGVGEHSVGREDACRGEEGSYEHPG